MRVVVGTPGAPVSNVDVADGATVNDALKAAEFTYEGQILTVNGGNVTLDTVLTENQYVFVKPAVKGA